jgi:hypothetical protein
MGVSSGDDPSMATSAERADSAPRTMDRIGHAPLSWEYFPLSPLGGVPSPQHWITLQHARGCSDLSGSTVSLLSFITCLASETKEMDGVHATMIRESNMYVFAGPPTKSNPSRRATLPSFCMVAYSHVPALASFQCRLAWPLSAALIFQ